MLVTTWFEDPHRPTRDLDLLGYGDPSVEAMSIVWKEICGTVVDDGITFDSEALRIAPIREDLEYGGLRIRTTATMARAKIAVTIDIGFGDAIEPGVEEIDLPVLLDLPVPRLRAYARETVIAEKFHAMIARGLANSRMKDFYDVWVLSKSYTFDTRLARAIAATFRRRQTEIPESLPDAFMPEFFRNQGKIQQWSAFVHDLSAESLTLETVASEVATFIGPYATEARAIVQLRGPEVGQAPHEG